MAQLPLPLASSFLLWWQVRERLASTQLLPRLLKPAWGVGNSWAAPESDGASSSWIIGKEGVPQAAS